MDVPNGDLAAQVRALKIVKEKPHLKLIWNQRKQMIQVRERPSYVPKAPPGFEWPKDAA